MGRSLLFTPYGACDWTWLRECFVRHYGFFYWLFWDCVRTWVEFHPPNIHRTYPGKCETSESPIPVFIPFCHSSRKWKATNYKHQHSHSLPRRQVCPWHSGFIIRLALNYWSFPLIKMSFLPGWSRGKHLCWRWSHIWLQERRVRLHEVHIPWRTTDRKVRSFFTFVLVIHLAGISCRLLTS